MYVLPADNDFDDTGDWNHCFGAIPAFHRFPVAAHAGESVTHLRCTEWSVSLYLTACLSQLAMTPIWTVQACVFVHHRRSALEAVLSLKVQLGTSAVDPVSSSFSVSCLL